MRGCITNVAEDLKMAARLIEKKKVAEKLFILKLDVKGKKVEPKAGQFFMIYPPRADKILGRPVSVFGYTKIQGKNVVEFLIKSAGGGTASILDLPEGANLRILGPLGNGFDLSQFDSKRIWLVAGGYGVAPLRFLMKELLANGKDVNLIYGAKAACDMADCQILDLPKERVFCAAECEPADFLGTSFELWEKKVEERGGGLTIACGPVGLLKSLWAGCNKNGSKLIVSLEARMGCGFGVCQSCAIPKLGGGYLRACYEGPAFDAAIVDWDRLESA